MKQPNPGTVIILNGTSSSGKSTILKELQKQLSEPYLEAGIDKFLWMLPKRYLEPPLWDEVFGKADRLGDTGHQLVYSMHHAIRALALSGSNVLADHVMIHSGCRQGVAHLLHDLPTYLVGVRCPLEVLEERERARKDRTLGQARKQFDLVHANLAYDIEVDTSLKSPEECALTIMNYIQSTPPGAIKILSDRLTNNLE